ncbi:MAG: ABC transporter ATP-binding protein [Anaerolineae bacterium]
MSECVYQLEQVQKSYESRRVLDIEALDVRQGEILAIVGPSGAGKTTLLRLMNFLEPPTDGHIHFRGCRYNGRAAVPIEVRRRVTTVFQRPMLLNRRVQDNVRYGLEVRGRRGTDERVRLVLERVGLAHLAKRRARTLSGGEAQRVALARAIVLEPDVLLLDEPTANLDPANVCAIEEIVRRLNQEQGTTIVIVTHNVFQAKRLADRVALLLDGRVVELGTTEQFFQTPQDPRTAAFVEGRMVY